MNSIPFFNYFASGISDLLLGYSSFGLGASYNSLLSNGYTSTGYPSYGQSSYGCLSYANSAFPSATDPTGFSLSSALSCTGSG